MINAKKFTSIIQGKTNSNLAKYYRVMTKRLIDKPNVIKNDDILNIIKLIKLEWIQRLNSSQQGSGAPNEGIMSIMGYRVGDTLGVKKEYRIKIMIDVLEGPLPYVDSPKYMQEWGEDSSIERFKKLRRFLIAEINSPLQKNNFRARSEWKVDLAWLDNYGKEYVKSDYFDYIVKSICHH